eukprot:364323-Chlamydomonas_euryale.AAC.10
MGWRRQQGPDGGVAAAAVVRLCAARRQQRGCRRRSGRTQTARAAAAAVAGADAATDTAAAAVTGADAATDTAAAAERPLVRHDAVDDGRTRHRAAQERRVPEQPRRPIRRAAQLVHVPVQAAKLLCQDRPRAGAQGAAAAGRHRNAAAPGRPVWHQAQAQDPNLPPPPGAACSLESCCSARASALSAASLALAPMATRRMHACVRPHALPCALLPPRARPQRGLPCRHAPACGFLHCFGLPRRKPVAPPCAAALCNGRPKHASDVSALCWARATSIAMHHLPQNKCMSSMQNLQQLEAESRC